MSENTKDQDEEHPSLTQLLEIDRHLLRNGDEEGLAVAEHLYEASNPIPTRKATLIPFLEMVIRKCRREGVFYPRILLLRLKQLDRGTWAPRTAAQFAQLEAAEESLKVSMPPRSEQQIIAEAKSTYTPEQFERWMWMHEQGRQSDAVNDHASAPPTPSFPGPQLVRGKKTA